jgi:hypothetical protein
MWFVRLANNRQPPTIHQHNQQKPNITTTTARIAFLLPFFFTRVSLSRHHHHDQYVRRPGSGAASSLEGPFADMLPQQHALSTTPFPVLFCSVALKIRKKERDANRWMGSD